MTFFNKILQFAVKHSDRLSQALNKNVLGQPDPREEMSALCSQAAAEGIVLLKNDGILPLNREEETALFGRVQNDYFYVGYGSGGDVNPHYRVSPMEAIRRRGDIRINQALAEEYRKWCEANPPFEGTWGTWPTYFDEMPITPARIREAAKTSRTAVVIVGRAMGESMDNKAKKGGYYLTNPEKKLLDQVCEAFARVVVVIDAGNILDLGWTEEYGDKIGALVYAWQGGMESGNALVDVLYGDSSPSGKLTDTVARNYADYPASANFGGSLYNRYSEDIYVGYRYFETFAPEQVLYPFGFGLSYTTFRLDTRYREENGQCILEVTVANTGDRSGAEVVQVYCNPPQGKLGKPVRNLVAFRKTGVLAPGEEETVWFAICPEEFASFDDSGITGHANAYVLEPGEYALYVGSDVRSAAVAGTWQTPRPTVVRQLTAQAAPTADFRRMKPEPDGMGRLRVTYEPVPRSAGGRKEDILAHLPQPVPMTGDRGIRFRDVCDGNAAMEDFIAQLDIEELDAITRGEGMMNSPLGTAGNAGILGGTTQSLRDKGVPVITTTDGPSGIRISGYSSLLPCGTALACSWNPALIEKLGTRFGEEMARMGSDIILGPGMNIHRDPLCGRNFEYYSEDPLLTGAMAAAVVRGVQSVKGRSACPKHFACNNQEWMRSRNDSRLSQRALREIYLKGFEICVKEGRPMTIMTSYNKINGVWGHYHYDLVTNILRKEWGFDGLVITDWWMQPAKDPDFPGVANDAYRIRAQVDVLMPGGVSHGRGNSDGSLAASYRRPEGITLGEIQRSAANVLRLCARMKGN